MFGGQFQIQNPDLTPLIALGVLQFSMTKNPNSCEPLQIGLTSGITLNCQIATSSILPLKLVMRFDEHFAAMLLYFAAMLLYFAAMLLYFAAMLLYFAAMLLYLKNF